MTHPILVAASVIDEALKAVADTIPTFLPTTDKAEALRELLRIESRVAELRMRILADSADLAAESGARDAAGWFADATRTRFEDARADLRLATALDRRWQALGAAVREGGVNTAQARVIVRALDALPDEVPRDVLGAAEASLIEHAARFTPKQLARIGHHVLTVVAPGLVDRPRAGVWPHSRPRAGDVRDSRSDAWATARPGSRASCPTPSPRGSRPTSRPTPTRAATSTLPPRGVPDPMWWPVCPTHGGSARRSASCWRRSTRSGSRSTVATPRR